MNFGSKNLYEPCKGVHCSDLTSLQQGKLSTDILMWICYQVGKVSVVSHITTAPGPPDTPTEPDTVCRSAAAINVSWEVSEVLCFQLLNLQSCKMGQILSVKKLSQTLQSAAMTFLSFLLKSGSIFRLIYLITCIFDGFCLYNVGIGVGIGEIGVGNYPMIL